MSKIHMISRPQEELVSFVIADAFDRALEPYANDLWSLVNEAKPAPPARFSQPARLPPVTTAQLQENNRRLAAGYAQQRQQQAITASQDAARRYAETANRREAPRMTPERKRELLDATDLGRAAIDRIVPPTLTARQIELLRMTGHGQATLKRLGIK